MAQHRACCCEKCLDCPVCYPNPTPCRFTVRFSGVLRCSDGQPFCFNGQDITVEQDQGIGASGCQYWGQIECGGDQWRIDLLIGPSANHLVIARPLPGELWDLAFMDISLSVDCVNPFGSANFLEAEDCGETHCGYDGTATITPDL